MIPWRCPKCGSERIQRESNGCNMPPETYCMDCGYQSTTMRFRKEYLKCHPHFVEEVCSKCKVFPNSSTRCGEFHKVRKLMEKQSLEVSVK